MGEFAAYIASVRGHARGRLWHAGALVIAAALVEGFGLLAILPLAALFTGDADNRPARMAIAVMDGLGLDTTFSRALALCALFIALLALRNMIVWRRETYLFRLGMDFVDHWRSRLFRAIGAAPWAAVSALRRTDVEHALTNDVSRLSGGTDRLLSSSVSVALVGMQLAILAGLAPLLLLVVLALMALAGLVALPLVRSARRQGERQTRAGRAIHGVLGNFLASQKLARLHDMQEEFAGRFGSAISETRAHQIAYRSAQSAARGWYQWVGGAAIVVALLVGLFALDTPNTILFLVLVLMARIVPPILALVQAGQFVANMLPAFAAVRTTEAVLLGEARATSDQAVGHAAQRSRDGPAALSLHDIRFRHPGQREWLIDGLSFEVAAGEAVALDAPSGAGKTTLLDLCAGLFPAARGTVAVDGQRLADEADWRAWRGGLAYLPQDPFLFDTSLRDNLLWCAPWATDAHVWEALEIAEAVDLVRALPRGLDARAGERGAALSGGERQRICLARGLLRNPRFVILDEATNALDRELEARILTRLVAMRERFSLLLVTHRSEALRYVDRIVTL